MRVRRVEVRNTLVPTLDLGIAGLPLAEVRAVYHLGGDLDEVALGRIVAEALVDPVVEAAVIDPTPCASAVDIAFLPGVTDSVAETVLEAARMLDVTALRRVATGTRVVFEGEVAPDVLARVATQHLANTVIQRFTVGGLLSPAFVEDASAGPAPKAARVAVRALDDDALVGLSGERRLSLNLEEMQAIRAHFQALGREPTDVELEMLAQTWSEHCVHKTFRAWIDYEEYDADGVLDPVASGRVDGILRSHIRAATETLDRPWVHSAFVDDAGIIAFDDELDVAFKVETHNHPSALEPFGGANTGVGGVIRDVIGVSARPIAVTDVLCFGPQDTPVDTLPDGVLDPRRVAAGVVDGIEDYGNKMGIPTVNGAVVYDPGYLQNPLVYCGCVGVLPRGSHPTEAQPGDLIVVIGGATGRDGLRGATFSSMEMDASTSGLAGAAVQIGHPIHEKQALEVIIEARDAGLYHAITDCGAGGLSSSVGEMGEGLGADVELSKVPLKYAGLAPWEIWLSEAQERMVIAVPEAAWPEVARIAARHEIGCDAIGRFRDDGVLRITSDGEVVAELATSFLHDGLPRRTMRAEWRHREVPARVWPEGGLLDRLEALLMDPNIDSREGIVRRYDHEVQGGTVVKPYVGVNGDGPGDAAVLVPFEAQGRSPLRGVSVSCAINPGLGRLDPYWMAWGVIDEAVRNAVAVGADPDQVAILDNFCWGNPNLPDRLGALVRCGRGCHDAAIHYGTPFISGKDSLNNEWRDGDGVSHPIPPTLLISALGIVPDVSETVTSDFKAEGDAIYVVGVTDDAPIPEPDPDAPEMYRALHLAIRAGVVRACHDCSDGGLLVALAEMAIGGALGFSVDLDAVPTRGEISRAARAFAETPSRLVVAVASADERAFDALVSGYPRARIGAVVAGDVARCEDGGRVQWAPS